jgi:geranylgeranylglycerol-phosphate geranylgeranyltransferase
MFLKRIISEHRVQATMVGDVGTKVVRGYVPLLRPANCAMAALGCLLAAVVCAGVGGTSDAWLEVSLSMAIVVLFTGAGNSLNDYFDREVDRVAHPARPIPAGLVRCSEARAISAVLFISACLLSFVLGPWFVVIVVTSMVFMVLYEAFLKSEGFAGNLAIAWLTGALFLFGGAAVDSMSIAWILALLAFLATLGREVIKDIQDLEGDSMSRRTLPMRLGRRNAGLVACAALSGAVLLSPAPYLLDLLSAWYLPVVLVADGIFIYSALIHFEKPEMGQKMAKLGMFAALVAFLLGGIF